MNKQYKIGRVSIEIEMPDELKIPENLKMFETITDKVNKSYIIELVDDLEPIDTQFRKENPSAKQILRSNLCVLTTPDQEFRRINLEGIPVPYAIHLEESMELTRVWVQKSMSPMLVSDTIFGALLGLEKVMLRDEAMILHSAFMVRDGKAILFSAPSGTGKSTQAELWTKYRGTRQINGDRSLLTREDEGWYANGWPICGSSEICYNESYPIQAIVMLIQAKENTIRRLNMFESMKKLMGQITINMWNSHFQTEAMDLIQKLIQEVPVYEMGCDMSEDAVRCLEKVLE